MSLPSWSWIAFTLFAVVMQTVRTAGQKHLTAHLDAMTVTLVRFLFGLPFVVAYLAIVMLAFDLPGLVFNPTFVVFTVSAAFTQIGATVLLVYLFSLRNFAVGTTYARTESFLTAVLGVTLFGEWIAPLGWAAIIISVGGVIVLTLARTEFDDQLGRQRQRQRSWSRLCNRAAGIGLLCGLLFALTSLSVRKASLALEHPNLLFSAGVTLACMVMLQSLVNFTYVWLRTPNQLAKMWRQRSIAWLVGATSALGSMGWFIAFTLERAAYVKSLGQIEFLLALAVSTLLFRERSNRMEIVGMSLVAIGVVVLVSLG